MSKGSSDTTIKNRQPGMAEGGFLKRKKNKASASSHWKPIKKQSQNAIVLTDTQVNPTLPTQASAAEKQDTRSPIVTKGAGGDPAKVSQPSMGINLRMEDLNLHQKTDESSSPQKLMALNSAKVEESFTSNVEDDERDGLKGQLMSGGNSLSSSKRGGSRIFEQIEHMKLSNKIRRESSSNLIFHKSMVERKSDLLSRLSFRNKLALNDDGQTQGEFDTESPLKATESDAAIKELSSSRRIKVEQRTALLIYPEDPLKGTWDVIITLTLLFTCLVVPVRIAFTTEDTTMWSLINLSVDIIFVVDILVTFNTGYYDEDFRLISKRKVIASDYIQSWFFIDLMAVIPFEIFSSNDNDEVSRVAKLSRMYRLAKLTRLLRIMKLFKKSQGSIFKQAQEFLRISSGFERLFNFFLTFFLLCHIVSCLWVTITSLVEEDETWIDPYLKLSDLDKYVTSIYFTVTTITTVGYGDINGTNRAERIFCVLIMVAGVISFSFASGSLASIIQNYDSQNAKLADQVGVLNKMYQDYKLPHDLYQRLKQSLRHSFTKDIDHLNKFLDEVPQNLRIELSLHIHADTYKNIFFMKDKSMSFIAWLCPLLKTYLVTPEEYIYFEGDEVMNVCFMQKGGCGFVLPKYANTKYINIPGGCDFGTEDSIACILKREEIDGEDWIQHRDKLIRQFTVMADKTTEILTLSVLDLNRIQAEFLEAYNKLMDVACQRLEYAIMIKMECISSCQQIQQQMDHDDKHEKAQARMSFTERIGLSIRDTFREKQIKFKFLYFNLADLDGHEDDQSIIYIPSEEAEDKGGDKDGNQEEIGQIAEVGSEFEQSSGDGLSVSSKSSRSSRSSSISSISSKSYQISSSSSSDSSHRRNRKKANKKVRITHISLGNQGTMSRQAQFDRLKTIMSKKDELLNEKDEEKKQGNDHFKRLQTVMKKNKKSNSTKKILNSLSKTFRGENQKPKETSKGDDNLLLKPANTQLSILDQLRVKKKQSDQLSSYEIPGSARSNNDRVEKLLQTLVDRADSQAKTIESMSREIISLKSLSYKIHNEVKTDRSERPPSGHRLAFPPSGLVSTGQPTANSTLVSNRQDQRILTPPPESSKVSTDLPSFRMMQQTPLEQASFMQFDIRSQRGEKNETTLDQIEASYDNSAMHLQIPSMARPSPSSRQEKPAPGWNRLMISRSQEDLDEEKKLVVTRVLPFTNLTDEDTATQDNEEEMLQPPGLDTEQSKGSLEFEKGDMSQLKTMLNYNQPAKAIMRVEDEEFKEEEKDECDYYTSHFMQGPYETQPPEQLPDNLSQTKSGSPQQHLQFKVPLITEQIPLEGRELYSDPSPKDEEDEEEEERGFDNNPLVLQIQEPPPIEDSQPTNETQASPSLIARVGDETEGPRDELLYEDEVSDLQQVEPRIVLEVKEQVDSRRSISHKAQQRHLSTVMEDAGVPPRHLGEAGGSNHSENPQEIDHHGLTVPSAQQQQLVKSQVEEDSRSLAPSHATGNLQIGLLGKLDKNKPEATELAIVEDKAAGEDPPHIPEEKNLDLTDLNFGYQVPEDVTILCANEAPRLSQVIEEDEPSSLEENNKEAGLPDSFFSRSLTKQEQPIRQQSPDTFEIEPAMFDH